MWGRCWSGLGWSWGTDTESHEHRLAEALAGRCQDDPLLWKWVDAGAIHRGSFPWEWTVWQRRGSLTVCWALEMSEIGAAWTARCHGRSSEERRELSPSVAGWYLWRRHRRLSGGDVWTEPQMYGLKQGE